LLFLIGSQDLVQPGGHVFLEHFDLLLLLISQLKLFLEEWRQDLARLRRAATATWTARTTAKTTRSTGTTTKPTRSTGTTAGSAWATWAAKPTGTTATSSGTCPESGGLRGE
jgi:hypothetical protein